jgi:hypothetical protein
MGEGQAFFFEEVDSYYWNEEVSVCKREMELVLLVENS